MSANSEIGSWYESTAKNIPSCPRLEGESRVDVGVIGGGYTGLSTALHLAERGYRVGLLEAEQIGWGASGRNGGWALGEYSISPMDWAARSTPEAAVRQMRGLYDAIDDIGRVAEAEGIDCHYAKGGWIDMARSGPQAERIGAGVRARHALGLTHDDVHWVDGDEARSFCNATNVVGGWFNRHVAAIHPSRLVRGLAEAVERLGGTIHAVSYTHLTLPTKA